MSVSSRSVPSELVSEGQGGSLVSDRRVRVDGVNLQYLEAGSGPPLLLVHGHEQSATSWRWVIPVFARTHRVLALSLPGHGDSAPAVGGYAPGADLAPLVADFLDTLGVGPLHVVGNSVGGAVVLRLALADPARVRTLTLVNSAGLGRDVHPLLALDTLPMIGELAIMISRMPGGDVGRTSMSAAMLFAQPSRAPKEFLAEQHSLDGDRVSWRPPPRWPAPCSTSTGNAKCCSINSPPCRCPPWSSGADCDYVLPASQAQAAVDRLPHGRLALFADCGHLPHVECPDRFGTVLSEWLAEHHDSS